MTKKKDDDWRCMCLWRLGTLTVSGGLSLTHIFSRLPTNLKRRVSDATPERAENIMLTICGGQPDYGKIEE